MERVKELIDSIGLMPNSLQVMEGLDNDGRATVFFPGFMTQGKVNPNSHEVTMLEMFQTLIEEHMLDVTNCLKLVKRYRKMYE